MKSTISLFEEENQSDRIQRQVLIKSGTSLKTFNKINGNKVLVQFEMHQQGVMYDFIAGNGKVTGLFCDAGV